MSANPTANEKHIVDVLIEERAKQLRHNRLVWPLITSWLYPALKYHEAINMADAIAPLPGAGVFDYVAGLLKLNVVAEGLEHIPREGPFMIVANHPTGIVDGIALYQALKPIRPDMKFIANRDALRVSAGLADLIVPVEWVVAKRSVAKTREMLKATRAAFESGAPVIMFPSGRVAQLYMRGLVDRPWHETVINIARRNEAHIVPLNIEAWNSWLYYFFAKVREELRDMTLFHELLNKKGQTFRLKFGPLIPYTDLSGEPAEEILRLRRYIETDLKQGAKWPGPTPSA